MIVYRIAYKIGDCWYVLGLSYPLREDADARLAKAKQAHPNRESIVVAIDEPTTDKFRCADVAPGSLPGR